MRRIGLLVAALLWLADGAALADTWQADIVARVNAVRAAHGLAPLTWNRRLGAAADAHALDLYRAGRLSHEGRDGATMAERLRDVGYAYRAAAENLALCDCDAAEVVRRWMTSDGHRRNLLNPDLREMGAGVMDDPDKKGRVLWVLNLGAL